MKRSGKIALAIAGAGVVGYFAYRHYKKVSKKILVVEQEEVKEIEDLGLDPKRVEEELVPEVDDKNFIKLLYMAARECPRIEENMIDEAVYSDDPICYVMQSKFWNKKENAEVNTIDFHFEIPDDQLGRFKMRDFVVSGKNLGKTLWNEVIRFCEEPHQSLNGYMVIGFSETPSGKIKQQVLKIPAFLQSNEKYTENSRSNGLEEFVKAINSNDAETFEWIQAELPKYLESSLDKEVYNVKVYRAFLTFKISFNIVNQSENPGTYRFGVDLKRAVNMLDHIVNKFEVKTLDTQYETVVGNCTTYRKPTDPEELFYEKLVFCAPGEDNDLPFFRYYDEDEDGHVFVSEAEFI